MTRQLTGLLFTLCLFLSACATGAGLSEELDRSAKAYSRMLRWHETENAVQTYAEPDQREESLVKIGRLKKNGLTITDFRILATRYLPESQSGDVLAEFDYHMLPSNRVKTVSHRQQWLYQDITKSWKLRNALPDFE